MGMSDDKWVRIMADYCSDGVWRKDGCAGDVDELPISQEIRDRMLAWQERFDIENCYWKPDCKFDGDEFSLDGLAIAKSIKLELPDWTVIYHDYAACERVVGDDGSDSPKEVYEFEIF